MGQIKRPKKPKIGRMETDYTGNLFKGQKVKGQVKVTRLISHILDVLVMFLI